MLATYFFCSGQNSYADDTRYVGAQRCQACHADIYRQWQSSHHYRAMQEVNPTSVLGDFANVRVNFHNIETRFFRRDNGYFVETQDQQGKKRVFEIRYTFGFYPLQQYLIPLEGGHLQVLNVAWDSRSAKEGGQRWFHLHPSEDITAEHPFFWTRHFQNWNGRCADCHSTNLQKNYDSVSHSFATDWSDLNVACESCHGPGAEHLALASTGKISKTQRGLGYEKHQPPTWRFIEGMPTAQPQGEADNAHINMCGDCHSLRVQLSQAGSPGAYHEHHALQLPQPPMYFADGQIREEVFVLGSFLQSKMYQKGVTCTNCHEPHSNALLIEGNGLCAQCHDATVFDTPQHHHHQANNSGAQCVNCHMPARRYMQVDDRRDHRFGIPRPDLSLAVGVPNACIQCHSDQDDQWASEALKNWGIKANKAHWAIAHQAAVAGDPLAVAEIARAVQSVEVSAINKAALLSSLAAIPSPETASIAQPFLRDENPLLRRAAVMALQNFPPQPRWQLLNPLLGDDSRSVRFALAETLADLLPQVPATEKEKLRTLITEYRESLSVSADFPATQLSLAVLETKLGRVNAAEEAFQAALEIEPNYLPALLNLADFYRDHGRETEVDSLLLRALEVAPESGAALHSYGLYLVRKKQHAAALDYLKKAVKSEDAQAHYAYVYAVALENRGELQAAIDVLVSANKRWPRQYSVLLTLVLYLERAEQPFAIPQYLNELTKIAPQSPRVDILRQKYLSPLPRN